VEPNFPTIEVDANIIENILNKNFISRPEWALYAELGIVVLFGVFLSFFYPQVQGRYTKSALNNNHITKAI